VPYIGTDANGEEAKRLISWYQPASRAFGPEVIARTERYVSEHSSFRDPGPDWNRVRAFGAHGNLIAEFTESGYCGRRGIGKYWATDRSLLLSGKRLEAGGGTFVGAVSISRTVVLTAVRISRSVNGASRSTATAWRRESRSPWPIATRSAASCRRGSRHPLGETSPRRARAARRQRRRG
jgi:hypothetical protein